MESCGSREVLRAHADQLEDQARSLRELADEMCPLTDAEATTRGIEEDDKCFLSFLMRVHRNVEENPHISATELAKAMGLPDNYPSPGSNYFTLELLNHLERFGMAKSHRHEKPFTWVALPVPSVKPRRILGGGTGA